jgi:acetyl-CoA C-acetyltransferase
MQLNEIYLVDAKRTPQAKAGTSLMDVPVPHLGVELVRYLLDKHNIPTDMVDEVVFGNTGAPAKYTNIGRIIALEAGLHKKTSGHTVHRNCASGLEAVSQGFLQIASGRADLVVAGGLESMSQMPLIYSKEMTSLFAQLMRAKTFGDKMKALSAFRPPHLSPVIAIEQGLTDPFCGLNMGQTAEILAREFSITRDDQDSFALNSHEKALAAQSEGRFDSEILPILIGNKLDRFMNKDNGPRVDCSMEKLAKLRPYFERKSGTVTVGNACPITDGGSALLLASKEAVKKYALEPMARVVDIQFSGLEPERMGMGPLCAMDKVLSKNSMALGEFDLFEINEAFAAQVIAVQKAMTDKSQAQRFGVDRVLGEIPKEKLNVNGGAIALGHPVGSTGSRLLVSMAHELNRRNQKFGLASLCIGGGQGGACILENLN